MSSIARSALCTLLVLCLPFAHAREPSALPEVVDPFLGVPLRWSELPEYETPILGLPENGGRRQLARVTQGHSDLILVLSIVPIEHDQESPEAPAGYEVDSGQLVKHFGNYASPLGAASGELGADYPELRSELLAELLEKHLDTVLDQYANPEELRTALANSPLCGHFDPLVLNAFRRVALELPPCSRSTPDDTAPTEDRQP